MNMLQIQYFLSVAKNLSFSRAAELNYTSQPSISRRIAALERELGFALFIRDRHNVVLTEAGKMLYHELDYLSNRLTSVIDAARKTTQVNNHLSIGYLKETKTSILSPYIQRFSQNNPQVSLEVEAYSFRTLHQKLIDSYLDIAILLSFDAKDLPNIARKPIYSSREHFMFSANHPLASKSNLNIQDFNGLQLVIADESSKGAAFALSQFSCCGISPGSVHRSASSEAIDLYIESRPCVGIMDTTNRTFHDSRFCFFEIPGDQAIVTLDAVWRLDSVNPSIKLFLDTLDEMIN